MQAQLTKAGLCSLGICGCCNTEAQVIAAIHRLDEKKIKGLGPAAANLLYFLHSTHRAAVQYSNCEGLQHLKLPDEGNEY